MCLALGVEISGIFFTSTFTRFMNAPQENQASTTDADSLHSPEAEARTLREKLFVYIFIFLIRAISYQ